MIFVDVSKMPKVENVDPCVDKYNELTCGEMGQTTDEMKKTCNLWYGPVCYKSCFCNADLEVLSTTEFTTVVTQEPPCWNDEYYNCDEFVETGGCTSSWVGNVKIAREQCAKACGLCGETTTGKFCTNFLQPLWISKPNV